MPCILNINFENREALPSVVYKPWVRHGSTFHTVIPAVRWGAGYAPGQVGELHGGEVGTARARAQYCEWRADNQTDVRRRVAVPVTNTMRAARGALALATMFCILWNADVPSWIGVAYLTEQYLALILGLSLCALFLSTRVSRAKSPNNVPWWNVALAVTAPAPCLYLVFRFPDVIDQLAFWSAYLLPMGGLLVLLVLEAERRDKGGPASKKSCRRGTLFCSSPILSCLAYSNQRPT